MVMNPTAAPRRGFERPGGGSRAASVGRSADALSASPMMPAPTAPLVNVGPRPHDAVRGARAPTPRASTTRAAVRADHGGARLPAPVRAARGAVQRPAALGHRLRAAARLGRRASHDAGSRICNRPSGRPGQRRPGTAAARAVPRRRGPSAGIAGIPARLPARRPDRYRPRPVRLPLRLDVRPAARGAATRLRDGRLRPRPLLDPRTLGADQLRGTARGHALPVGERRGPQASPSLSRRRAPHQRRARRCAAHRAGGARAAARRRRAPRQVDRARRSRTGLHGVGRKRRRRHCRHDPYHRADLLGLVVIPAPGRGPVALRHGRIPRRLPRQRICDRSRRASGPGHAAADEQLRAAHHRPRDAPARSGDGRRLPPPCHASAGPDFRERRRSPRVGDGLRQGARQRHRAGQRRRGRPRHSR